MRPEEILTSSQVSLIYMKPLENKVVYNTSHLVHIKSAFRIVEGRDHVLEERERFMKMGLGL